MISSIKMNYQRHGCETCVATLEVETSNGTVVRTLDFSGNAISATLFGAVQVINALQEVNGDEPLGYVEIKKEKRKKVPTPTTGPKYELCDTVFPSGEKCVRPKNHTDWSKAKCSPTCKFMEYSADTQIAESKLRQIENKIIRESK